MMRLWATVAIVVCLAGVAFSQASVRPAPKRTQVAEGVFVFSTASYGDVGLDGNSVVVLSRDGVLVFDSNGTPAASAAVLAEIRKLTPQPVRYLVHSHWHWDHWYGAETYKAAFPDLQVIAHEKTQTMMMGPALAFNKPGLERDLPRYIEMLETKAAAARKSAPESADTAKLEQLLADDRFFLEQKRNVRHTFPNVTYSSAMDLYLGERRVLVRHYDRAVTPGDTFLYLPSERILITGDLLVNPISFALSCYPTGWLRTLERIDALDATVIVPGHGDALHDKTLLRATMEVFRVLLREGESARSRGLDPDQAREAIMPKLHDLIVTITRNDPRVTDAFRVQLVDWYLHRVYDELTGPLTDDIAPIPPK